jgi:hypothetical protein
MGRRRGRVASIAAVRGHAERLLEDLASWERVALDTRIDGATA